jgi:catechol 2,3-dioxygenase-like lactoylglutathione lyase family enzyme
MGKSDSTPTPRIIRCDALSLVTVMCDEIPKALQFYVGNLGFVLKADEVINGERFVVAMPPQHVEFQPVCSLRFKQAQTKRDFKAVGNQAGDGVFLQIECDDWDFVYHKLKTMGTKMVDHEPRDRGSFRAVTIEDPMGNKVNFIEKTTTIMGRVFERDVGHGEGKNP